MSYQIQYWSDKTTHEGHYGGNMYGNVSNMTEKYIHWYYDNINYYIVLMTVINNKINIFIEPVFYIALP